MSYDLMVFEPDAAPADRAEFLDWYRRLTRWTEGHNYNDPRHTTPALQRWYREMIETFPAMNGPDALAADDPRGDSPYVTGYSCASNAIYLDFRWSVQEEAYRHVLMYAAKHRVGFYDVSATDGAVWRPTAGGYEIAHGGGPGDQDTVKWVAAWFNRQG
jgi:hypothetical protein